MEPLSLSAGNFNTEIPTNEEMLLHPVVHFNIFPGRVALLRRAGIPRSHLSIEYTNNYPYRKKISPRYLVQCNSTSKSNSK